MNKPDCGDILKTGTADLMKTGGGCFAKKTTFYLWSLAAEELQLVGEGGRGNNGSRLFELKKEMLQQCPQMFWTFLKQEIITVMQYTCSHAWN